jgi:hypothetical protein
MVNSVTIQWIFLFTLSKKKIPKSCQKIDVIRSVSFVSFWMQSKESKCEIFVILEIDFLIKQFFLYNLTDALRFSYLVGYLSITFKFQFPKIHFSFSIFFSINKNIWVIRQSANFLLKFDFCPN